MLAKNVTKSPQIVNKSRMRGAKQIARFSPCGGCGTVARLRDLEAFQLPHPTEEGEVSVRLCGACARTIWVVGLLDLGADGEQVLAQIAEHAPEALDLRESEEP